ncbi:hypothetical protein N7448_008522 [Penicillium atrosanguineum]|uniref:Peptidase M20 dimerisation domain-containing protein n=1 Tax=Penicillium atrosanguineum TaxID=1132637 RepID=A0A9W9KZG0_9EURO|nr:uncharacterized protein N7443_000463 [Penicillium atrosanguineum]KAJ5127743.1 hypothetical protein N7448_008522 [Penicillium atrosanguineum]KAJ5147952.1 hypothetical protein N7526_001304 [Penicillium atrosanguineum]KAJ5313579.1 hypothetical protein N7443_000463 [Penicillium atrosanguineum]KAJ5330753.1 hypothetical protein N7476_000536 [Penicillium atrosanguineum]
MDSMMASAVVTLLRQLMQIPSISNDEHDIGLFLEKHLQSLGYTVERILISPDSCRCNVYAYLGSSRKTRICLTSHMDTVPPQIPMRLTPDTIYGQLRAEGRVLPSDVSFLLVVGEEKGGPGMTAVNPMNLSWETVISGEPTEGKLAVGHKGHFVFELISEGAPAHSGYPQRGRSAVSAMTAVVAALERTTYPSSDIFGPSTFHCGQNRGASDTISLQRNARHYVRFALQATCPELSD